MTLETKPAADVVVDASLVPGAATRAASGPGAWFDAWTAGDEPEALKMRARGWALALGLAYLAHSRDDAEMASLGYNTVNAALNEP